MPFVVELAQIAADTGKRLIFATGLFLSDMVFPFVFGLLDRNRCKVQSAPKRRDRQRRAAASQEFFRPRSGALSRKNCEKPPFDGKRRVRENLHRIRLRLWSPENRKARNPGRTGIPGFAARHTQTGGLSSR